MSAIEKTIQAAREVGINAAINPKPGSDHRTHQTLGSRFSPAKPIILNGIKMSLAQARQYIKART